MPFVHSSSTRLLFGATHLSTYVTSGSEEFSCDVEDSTTIIDTARRYIAGTSDGTVSIDGLFDGDAGAIHAAFSVLKSTHDPVVLSYAPQGFAVGDPVEMASVLRGSYGINASVAGITSVSMSGQADGGVDSGVSLADLTARSTTAEGDTHDGGAASSNGGAAHLHVVAADGTLDVKVQHSTDGDNWVDLVTFTQATAAEAQRVEVDGTVNRYLRAEWTIGGADPEFEFAVAFARR